MKALKQSIASFKQRFEDGEVEKYSWREGKDIVMDVLNKQWSKRKVLDELMKENIFR